MPEGLKTLSVRQSSDIFATDSCRKRDEFPDGEGERADLQAVSMCHRNYEHRMIVRGTLAGNTWVGEEKSGGHRLEARQMGFLERGG
jgi:hypothetical protein